MLPGRRVSSNAVKANGCLGAVKAMIPFAALSKGCSCCQKMSSSLSASCSQNVGVRQHKNCSRMMYGAAAGRISREQVAQKHVMFACTGLPHI